MRNRWWPRLLLLAVLLVGGQVALTLMDFDPDPVGWGLLVVVATVVVWLAQDTLDAGEADWHDGRAERAAPATEEQTVHGRVVAGHLASRDPGPALRDRLVELARSRDPALTDPELLRLSTEPPRRLSPAEIDHYLTRIEALRDHD
jgi:hypothetical protein